MGTIKINFNQKIGNIKPMHCVNNGPVWSDGVEQVRENFSFFKEAKIPYVRNHDAAFYALYGGEHTVDVHAIFPDFSRDVNDEDAYDFTYTDLYTEKIIEAGSQVFYRFGSKIEHGIKKYGTIVPADFNKWARICEHIIRHYNEGWANGFHYGIEYWEIWNEADGKKPNGDQPNWSGTPEQFYELYTITAKHLKTCFPDLKIGGPAISDIYANGKWMNDFLAWISKEKAPLDFFSWHGYETDPKEYSRSVKTAKDKLESAGYGNAQTIINEWNYVEGWTDLWVASIEHMKSMRGAAFVSATMLEMQKSPIDMMMYYDARPCPMNGLFDSETLRPIKGYFAIRIFSELYKLGNEVFASADEPDLYTVAAMNGEKASAVITYYSTDKNARGKWVSIELDGIENTDKVRYYLVDKNYTMYERKANIEDGKLRIYLEAESILMVTNYCINE